MIVSDIVVFRSTIIYIMIRVGWFVSPRAIRVTLDCTSLTERDKSINVIVLLSQFVIVENPTTTVYLKLPRRRCSFSPEACPFKWQSKRLQNSLGH